MSSSALYHEWAGIARDVLDSVGFGDGPTEIVKLARAHGFRLVGVDGRHETGLLGNTICYDRTLSRERRRADVAHELAHWALERGGWPHARTDELAAGYVAAAILCPHAAFLRDLRAHGFDLAQVRKRYGVSWELAARRVADVCSSIVTVVDNGMISTRVQSHWIRNPYARRLTRWEQALVGECRRTQDHVREQDLVRAYWVPGDDGWERVILVVGLDELEEAAGVA